MSNLNRKIDPLFKTWPINLGKVGNLWALFFSNKECPGHCAGASRLLFKRFPSFVTTGH